MSEKRLFSMKADDDLLCSFRAVCKAKDLSQAQVVRNLMRDYIAKQKQPDLFETKRKLKN